MAGFNFADRKDIERVLQMIRSPSPLPNFGTEEVSYITEGFLLQTPASGIPARSGTTAGKAACTPYFIDSQNGDTLTELTDNDDNPQSYDVYNVSASAVAGSAYILAKRVYGVLIVDMEDCG